MKDLIEVQACKGDACINVKTTDASSLFTLALGIGIGIGIGIVLISYAQSQQRVVNQGSSADYLKAA